MLHMDWKRLHKLHKIIHNGETVLVNTFTEITIVYSEVLQMLCREFVIMEIRTVFFFFPVVVIGLFCYLNSIIIYYYEPILK